MLKVASSAGLLVVLVCVKANFTDLPIFLAVVMAFAGFECHSGYGVGLLLELWIPGSCGSTLEIFNGPYICLANLVCKCQGLLSGIIFDFKIFGSLD